MSDRRIIRDLDGTPRYVDDAGVSVWQREVQTMPAKGKSAARTEIRETRVRWITIGERAHETSSEGR